MDLGPRWTVLTWRQADAMPRLQTDPAAPWPLRALLRPAARAGSSQPPSGLVVGWLGYEAGAACERMPAPTGPRLLPDVALWRCEGALALDRLSQTWWLAGDRRFQAEAEALLHEARHASVPPGPPPGHAPPPPPGAAERYQEAVRAALADIRAGRLYQVNLSWALDGPATPDPVGAWLAVRRANPARHGALLRHDDGWVLSNSPERYLEMRPGQRGLRVLSVPIKGTARRDGGRAAARSLMQSEKERAELTMIVDLVRNDLGRVAVPGSVRPGRRRLEPCGDLWHAEQAVAARLLPGLDAQDAIAASFPPGSVTGAPKVAAMEAIHRLEDQPRGIYCGSLVCLADDGRGWLNVAIRTATLRGGRARVQVGAGIVADSDPLREWEETLAKARALARHVYAPA